MSMYVCGCVHVCMRMHMCVSSVDMCIECRCPWSSEEGVGYPGAGLSGGCKLPDVDARN